MSTWARSGPVVVEVDGTAEGLRVIDYACVEALRSGADLVLAASFRAHSTFSPMRPGDLPKPPDELADAWLRVAVGHVRHRYGYGLQLEAVSKEGSRPRVLAEMARHARMLIVGRTPKRGPQRLLAAQANLSLAARVGCPVLVVPLSWKPSAVDRKVAVGVDGSALSTEAVEFAFRAAADRGRARARELGRRADRGRGSRQLLAGLGPGRAALRRGDDVSGRHRPASHDSDRARRALGAPSARCRDHDVL